MTVKRAITIPTKDVLNSETPTDFVLESTFNHLKDKIDGSFTQTINAAGTYTATIAHGLTGKRPLAMAYFRDTSSNRWFIAMTHFGVAFSDRKSTEFHVEVYTDTTNVYINVVNGYASQKTIEVQYEIFYENA